MPTITISRQFGSHGDTVAQLLCERLDYRYFDKNLMLGLAVQSGLPVKKLVDVSEEKPRARSLVERLSRPIGGEQGADQSRPNAARLRSPIRPR